MQPAETTQAPTVIFRPAAQRFHSRLDWLDSRHSFSFAGHVDPDWMGFGPLRVINDDTIAAGRGFGMHPHRDMEIITVMVDGELSHKDSMGHSAVIHAGEVQRMSAGTGITHSEMNNSTESCRLLQIWIEPEERGILTAYEQKSFPIDADLSSDQQRCHADCPKRASLACQTGTDEPTDAPLDRRAAALASGHQWHGESQRQRRCSGALAARRWAGLPANGCCHR